MLFCILFNLGMTLIFVLFGLWFYRRGEQACRYLSGYTALSDTQRAKLNLSAMGRAYGARMLWMAVPFLVGAAIDFFCAGAWLCACVGRMDSSVCGAFAAADKA